MLQQEDPKAPSWIHEETVRELEEANTRRRIGTDMFAFVLEVDREEYDSLVFLDKSARPVAWLFMDMYKRMFPHRTRPNVHFVNIGRETTRELDSLAPTLSTRYEDLIREDKLMMAARLRRIFSVGIGERDSRGERILSDSTYFDDKSVCIVDEFSVSGTSLVVAQCLFEEAFTGRYKGQIHIKSLFSKEPPWYQIFDTESTRKEELLGVIDIIPNSLQVKPFPSTANIWLRREIARTAKEAVAAR